MLTSLHIENIAVIKQCDIDFSARLCVLTGQTGTGKSVVIGSLDLLCGGRFSKDQIRTGEESACVCGSFEQLSPQTLSALAQLGFEEETFYIQRIVHTDGKSQARCNGRVIPLSLQRQIMSCLLHIHGQHDNNAFLSEQTHLSYLDAYAGTQGLLDAYRAAYDAMQKTQKLRDSLAKDEQEKARLLEMLQYQIADIDAVGPRAGEEEKLEAEKKRLQNAEHIAKSARLIRRALYRNDKGFSAFDLLERAEQALQGLQGVMEKAQDFANTVQEYRYELADIAESVAAFAEEDGEDPAKKLDRIEGRLEALSKLRRKYGADTEAVLAYRAQAAKRLAEIENADALAQEYEKTLQAQTKQALAAANALRDARRTAAERLCREMEREFSYLDMEKVRFSVCAEPRLDAAGQTVFAPDGIDTVRFLIATNPGEPFKPLSKIASGGELARVMLAAKSVLHAKDGATMVFDEVDSGVSGATSHKIGLKLRALGSAAPSAQVLCVTHSAQIAAVADAQYLIEKKVEDGRTYSGVRLLDKVQRIEELARIIAGNEITEAARQSARALLAEAKKENRDS